MSAGELGTTGRSWRPRRSASGVTGRLCETRLGAAMSADTYNALEAALRAHIADSNPDWPILTDWVLLAASAGNDALLTGYTDACSESPTHALEGLLSRGLRRIIARDEGDDDE